MMTGREEFEGGIQWCRKGEKLVREGKKLERENVR